MVTSNSSPSTFTGTLKSISISPKSSDSDCWVASSDSSSSSSSSSMLSSSASSTSSASSSVCGSSLSSSSVVSLLSWVAVSGSIPKTSSANASKSKSVTFDSSDWVASLFVSDILSPINKRVYYNSLSSNIHQRFVIKPLIISCLFLLR